MSTIFEDLKNAFRRYDNGLNQLILINIIIFVVFQLVGGVLHLSGYAGLEQLISAKLSVPASLSRLIFQPWSIITYFFFHEGWMHIIFNMLFLFWFGSVLTEFLGPKKILGVYMLGGIMGALFFIIAYNLFPVFKPLADNSLLLGASGAVYAVVLAAATLVPNYTFNLLLIGPVKIVYIAAFYILFSFAEIRQGNPGGNLAHLGGAFMGFVYIWQLRNGLDLGKPIVNIIEMFAGMFAKPQTPRTPKFKVTKTNASRNMLGTSESTEAEIDAILDKINKTGYESLSREEKEKLFQASQKS